MEMIKTIVVHLRCLGSVPLHPETSMLNASGHIRRKFVIESRLAPRRQMCVSVPFPRKEVVTEHHQLNAINEILVDLLAVKTTGADHDLTQQPIGRIYQNDLVHPKSLREIVDPHPDGIVIDRFLLSNEMCHLQETLVPTTEMYINPGVKNS